MNNLYPVLSSALIALSVFTACASAPPVQGSIETAVPPAEIEQSASQKRAVELVTDTRAPVSGEVPPEAKAEVLSTSQSGDASPVEISPAEKTYFERYLKRLTYMVVMKEGTRLSGFQVQSVLARANDVLLKQGFTVIQYEQLQKKMEDERAAFEAEAGDSMSLIQYLARKLGADVYVEIDAAASQTAAGEKYYGEASFAVSLYDPSTAELMGAVASRSEKAVSTTSPEDAVLNALVAGTGQCMGKVVRETTQLLRVRCADGIHYQVIMQSPPDSRVLSAFRKAIRSRVREVKMGDSAGDQVLLDFYFFGSVSDLQDACEAAFERTPGLEGAYWVFSRGKTITFNSGF